MKNDIESLEASVQDLLGLKATMKLSVNVVFIVIVIDQTTIHVML